MRVVSCSDTHGKHRKLQVPDGDIFIHAGDITLSGEADIIEDFNEWLAELPHQVKIVIAGNHDFNFINDVHGKALTAGVYLRDNWETFLVNEREIVIYGSPYTPRFGNWAFMGSPSQMQTKWEEIPDGLGVDILVTHGPPYQVLDRVNSHVYDGRVFPGQNVGCFFLRKRVQRLKPRLHVFGHIHEGYGMLHDGKTTYVNACSLDDKYQNIQQPMVVEI